MTDQALVEQKLWFNSLSLAHISFSSFLSFSTFLICLSSLFFAAVSGQRSLFFVSSIPSFFVFRQFFFLPQSPHLWQFFSVPHVRVVVNFKALKSIHQLIFGNIFPLFRLKLFFMLTPLFSTKLYRLQGRHLRKHIEISFDFWLVFSLACQNYFHQPRYSASQFQLHADELRFFFLVTKNCLVGKYVYKKKAHYSLPKTSSSFHYSSHRKSFFSEKTDWFFLFLKRKCYKQSSCQINLLPLPRCKIC